MNNWCVIYTHQGKELYSVSELNKQNFNTYMPSIMKIVRHSRYIKKVLKPFFPRYIFAQINFEFIKDGLDEDLLEIERLHRKYPTLLTYEQKLTTY